MQNKFVKIFGEELLKEIPLISIGIFPGKFKLPHVGHFKTAKVASSQNKVVFVLISEKEHEGYTSEQSLQIWSIYRNYLKNIEPFIVTRTPVIASYELLNILNNGGDFLPTKSTQQPITNVNDIIQSSQILQAYLNKGNNFNINLYSSPEDSERFRNAEKEPFSGRNITKIQFQPVDRLTSATAFRAAIKSKDFVEIEKFLPSELTKEDKIKVINILNANV
jgi:hypothetical protein